MKIVFTKHARRKFEIHKAAGWKFSDKDIRQAIKKPYFSEINKERGVKIVLEEWDKQHDLRVICKDEGGIITVVTFYPVEKGRYAK